MERKIPNLYVFRIPFAYNSSCSCEERRKNKKKIETAEHYSYPTWAYLYTDDPFLYLVHIQFSHMMTENEVGYSQVFIIHIIWNIQFRT